MANRYVTGVVCMALLVGLLMAEEPELPEGKVCTDKCKVCQEADAVAFEEKYGTGRGLGGCKQQCTDEGSSFACGAASMSLGGAFLQQDFKIQRPAYTEVKEACCPCGPDQPQDCNYFCKTCQADHEEAFAQVYGTGFRGLGGCQRECVKDLSSFACGGVGVLECCPCNNDDE